MFSTFDMDISLRLHIRSKESLENLICVGRCCCRNGENGLFIEEEEEEEELEEEDEEPEEREDDEEEEEDPCRFRFKRQLGHEQ